MPLFVSLCLSMSLYVSLYISMSLYVSFDLFVCLSLCLCHSLDTFSLTFFRSSLSLSHTRSVRKHTIYKCSIAVTLNHKRHHLAHKAHERQAPAIAPRETQRSHTNHCLRFITSDSLLLSQGIPPLTLHVAEESSVRLRGRWRRSKSLVKRNARHCLVLFRPLLLSTLSMRTLLLHDSMG